jgi:hypothetical protein
MTSMVAQELVRAADAPQATRAELERERREVVAQLREAAESGDDAAARALCRRRDEIDGQIAADAELDALRAARSRKQARAAQREQLVAQKAEWLARAAELEPERARLAAAWQEIEGQWQLIGQGIRGAEDRLGVFELQDAEDDKRIEVAISRLTGGA